MTMSKQVQRYAFTVVELLVVTAIIATLVGIFLPAIQAVRESTRRVACQNKLRQLALATLSFEASHGHLPYSSLNAMPDSADYVRDTSWLVFLLPYLDQHALKDKFDSKSTLFSRRNSLVFQAKPELFQCPSAKAAGRLVNISNQYSGPEDSGLFSVTGDYRGCSGFNEYSSEFRFAGNDKLGPMAMQIVPGNRVARLVVPDGRSQTMLAWESPGAIWYSKTFGRLIERSWDELFLGDQLWTVLGTENEGPFANAETVGTKAYFSSWAGFSTSRVASWDANGLSTGSYWDDSSTFNSVVNITNKFGQPFSFHPGVCNVVMLDGSTQAVHESVEVPVFFGQSTLSGANPHR